MAAMTGSAPRSCCVVDHVVIPDDAYGGIVPLIDKVFTQWGAAIPPVVLADLRRCADRPHPVDLAETLTNLMLPIATSDRRTGVAHGAKFADNTLLLTRTAAADAGCRHRAAFHHQYIGGHSDVVGGACDQRRRSGTRRSFLQNGAGRYPGPSTPT